ncbi:DUF1517 domain-containing protein [Myxococcota bacterium]|nr:DUF1517 domain-containing protein [Myxococcota bacterium]
MGLFDRKRHTVSTIIVVLDADDARTAFSALSEATDHIARSDGDHAVASEAVADVAGFLLEHRAAWTHVANWGEVFRREEEAAEYGDEVFAECASRYVSSRSAGAPREDDSRLRDLGAPRRGPHPIVVMVTVGYRGEIPALEKTLATRNDVDAALSAIIALHHRDALDLAALHFAPGHEAEFLTDDQLMMNFPELLPM